jgi:transaldolase / glucose-6-phosphate isomerase
MNPLLELEKQGQAIWLDYISRNLLTTGGLKALVEQDGLSGVTSNPTIFEKAIAGSTDYDQALRLLIAADPHQLATSLFESLAVEDIQAAADTLRPVYDATAGADGCVSLEVSPKLAHDTQGSIREARRLWQRVNRPNLMIKIPATPEGIPAIEELLASGINVNITLMFSLAHYESVAQAYLRGAARCAHPERLASVASFFVSRVDTKVDAALEKIGSPEALALRGNAAIDNSKLVYKRFLEIFEGPSFAALRARGTRPQRVLWASTSTKNPNYPDVMYLTELIGPHTVNTVPPATLKAFRDHGTVRGVTVSERLAESAQLFVDLKKLGVNLDAITAELQTEGVASFSQSFDELMDALQSKRHTLLAASVDAETQSLGPLASRVEARLAKWDAANFGRRLWSKDFTLWSAKPVPEITDRLGWLHLPDTMHDQLNDLLLFREEVKGEGFTHAVLLGMGGSSLAPEVFMRTFSNAPGYPRLIVLDSTHPQAVRNVDTEIDLSQTLFCVSSKSGTTTEMLSFFYHFWQKVAAISKTPGRQFIAITDPGTPLEKLAKERGFRRFFSATPDVGGRYSALTHFGLVPAALIGMDVHHLLDRAWTMQEACAASVPVKENPGLVLGAILGEAALAGHDKVTFIASKGISAFPTWLGQLIAESTGKSDKGIIPVGGESLGAPALYGSDRLFVYLTLDGAQDPSSEAVAAVEAANHLVLRIRMKELADIGQEFFRWEIGVAAAGAVIGIQPFNQPDVQLAKDLAREAMQSHGSAADERATPLSFAAESKLRDALAKWIGSAKAGDYIGLDAYLAPSEKLTCALETLRIILRDRARVATMLGYGPSFLHSTGQLHKGGPNTGLFLQLLDEPASDLAVPETDYTFGQLIRAQALGDYHALVQRGRRVLRISLGADAVAGVLKLAEALRG